jgi:nitrate reductase delta subunit
MLGFFRRSDGQAEALRRIRDWTRAHFRLPEDATVMVTEVACALPGCAPLETVVAFWTAPDRRHHFKVFKPAAEVVPEDLPPRWMKDALIEIKGIGCACC